MKPFPIADISPVVHENPLPKAADLVVIGGGVIGITTALFAARDGLKVVVLEKGRVAGEQSGRNWGWIRVQGRDHAEVPIACHAQQLWQELAAQLDTDIGLRQSGVAYLAANPQEEQEFLPFLAVAKEHGLSTRLLNGDATADLMRGARTRFHSALWTETDMRAEPFLAVPALARLAAREGVCIVENCAVRGLDRSGGKVTGVLTERGHIIKSRQVVLAAGAWSSLFLRRHGVTIPQLAVRATVAQTKPLPEVASFAATGGGPVSFRRRADGGYTLAPGGFHEFMIGPDAVRACRAFWPLVKQDPFGTRYLPAAPNGYPDAWTTPRRWRDDEVSPFERVRVLNPRPHLGKVEALARGFATLFPDLGEVGLERAWAGMIDAMPDVVPIVDAVQDLPGVILATGMSGHGFGIGPGFGRIVADLVQGRAPGHDISRFRFSRFSEGAPLELGPAL
ncbi:NAD(P)/FAD-dependent oxidoreductase [Aliiroseovarius crassostreae]|uniref:NAD(P)/FAD-dependent oxidoreductase n=1 Tax=Aliiroseovarius crassostreae TaxID=154981 RepID=UPI0022097071|nr:FAD-binding oxidoreductase [Aliiroseovarius crassostreae]UWP87980.1 FAD-binding oxidoreductase [Aliiroseovarius crassostreae]